ncbi:hypothetical protein AB3R30_18920 [Leptolyngbyaceae cyanobacterium UHCC 1019]
MNLIFEDEIITLQLAEQGIQGPPGLPGSAAPPQSAEADEAIAPNQAIYLKANGHCALAIANDPAKSRVAGFAITSANPGFTCEYRPDGLIEGLSGLNPGSIYYLSNSIPGQITQISPATGYLAPIGQAFTSSKLKFKFYPVVRL